MNYALLTAELRQRAEAIGEWASRREHWYRPGRGMAPGYNPAHVLTLGTYRAVFSWTFDGQRVWRHLSMSVEHGSRDRAPRPEVAFTVATWFGFTGANVDDRTGLVLEVPDGCGWDLGINRAERALVLVQEVPEQELEARGHLVAISIPV